MFCPKCGNEVKEGDMFCGECGTRMEPLEGAGQETEVNQQEVNQQEATPVQPEVRVKEAATNEAPKQKSGGFLKGFSDRSKKIVIAEIALLIVLVAAFFYIGNRKSSPESAANQFVKDYNDKNWSKVYESYNLTEGTFINAEAFEKTMVKNYLIYYDNMHD